MRNNEYLELLNRKGHSARPCGLKQIPDMNHRMFGYQRECTEFLLRVGNGAAFLDTGLGKSFIELEWLRVLAEHTNKPVILFAPLAVGSQHAKEADRFGIEARVVKSSDEVRPGINISNYERLHLFDPKAFGAMSCDESSIIKSFTGATTRRLGEFGKSIPYKLAATATPAPNDHMELGQHCQFLEVMDSSEMLSRWFIADQSEMGRYRLKRHGVKPFWAWVSSWARCMARPSDLGYSDEGFVLPELVTRLHSVETDLSQGADEGQLFRIPSTSATSIHREKRLTANDRAEMVAEIVASEPNERWVIWVETDYDADAVMERVPDAVEVRGSMPADEKESKLIDFSAGNLRVLLSKPRIAGFGLNWQHCARTVFAGVSFCFDEDTEILTRRGWRSFGEVTTDDDVAAVAPSDLRLRWEKPSNVTWEYHDGEMVRFGGQRSFDLLVTPNHRMLVKRCEVRYGRDCGEWHFREAGDLVTNWKRQEYRLPSIPRSWQGERLDRTLIPIPDGYRYSSRSKVVGELDARQVAMLAGWYLSEGHVRADRNIFVISQSDVNPENRAEIIGLLQSLGLNVGSKTKDIYACSQNLSTWLADQFGVGSYEKRIPAWLRNADSETLRLLRDTMIKGDGCHHRGRISAYRSYSRQLQDDFQEICLKTGMKASVKPNWGGVMLGHEYFEPSISVRPTLEAYEGMIGCVTVPSGAILVRRNGIPVITGNSYESYYQAIRRFWRFGQTRQVHAHVVLAETELQIWQAIKRKSADHERMKSEMVMAMRHEHQSHSVRNAYRPTMKIELPEWIHG